MTQRRGTCGFTNRFLEDWLSTAEKFLGNCSEVTELQKRPRILALFRTTGLRLRHKSPAKAFRLLNRGFIWDCGENWKIRHLIGEDSVLERGKYPAGRLEHVQQNGRHMRPEKVGQKVRLGQNQADLVRAASKSARAKVSKRSGWKNDPQTKPRFTCPFFRNTL